jgi:uncharacterized HAD superfamily protein
MKKRTLSDILNNSDGAMGVDIDDVIITLKDKFLSHINSTLGYRLKKPFRGEDYVWLALEDVKAMADAGITREDISSMLKVMESEGVIENIMPRVHCMSSLKALSKTRDVYFVTSRGDNYYNDAEGMTDRWLVKVEERYNFRPKEVIFNHNKEKVLSEKKIKLFFEDNPLFTMKLLDKGIPVILFDALWNYMNNKDRALLSEKAYEQKKSVIERIEKYNDSLLFRVPDWSYIIRNLQ